MEIQIQSELTVKSNNLIDYLKSKYLFRMNTESIRHEILVDIDNWYMHNIDLWSWERDANYRKSMLDQIEKSKLNYYTVLINQSGLDDEDQRDMIFKYAAGRNENDWISYCNRL